MINLRIPLVVSLICFIGLSSGCKPRESVASKSKETKKEAHLVVSGSPEFDFGSVRWGEVVTHEFEIRNDGDEEALITRFDSSCGCITVAAGAANPKEANLILAAGASVKVQVVFDTARANEVSSSTLTGSTIRKEVWVYVAKDSVHPALLLTMQGHITHGVAFEPSVLNFGAVSGRSGTNLSVLVHWDSKYYVAGKTHLELFKNSGLKIEKISSKGEPAGPQLTEEYRISIPAGSPVMMVNGAIQAVGLDARKVPKGAPLLTDKLVFIGEIVGNVVVEPKMVVFGIVRKSSGKPSETDPQRTRWMILHSSDATDEAFWNKVKVQAGAAFIHARVLPKTKAIGVAPAGMLAALARYPEKTAALLEVSLSSETPHGKSVDESLKVSLPTGESLILPVQAEVE